MARKWIGSSLVQVLRSSGIAGITWGDKGSPHYDQAQEPPPDFPYVVLEIDESQVTDNTFEEPFVDTVNALCHVIGVEDDVLTLSSPYELTSIINYLDGLRDTPQVLDGDNFTCSSFLRKGYMLKRDPAARAPDGQRVWIGSGRYELTVQPKGTDS